LDNGLFLIDSTLIIDYLETQCAGRRLMPGDSECYATALQYVGVAMVAMEKVAQIIYETTQRPVERQHAPWLERLRTQLEGALELMESIVAEQAGGGGRWLYGEQLTHADISLAVAWRFIQFTECVSFDPADFPALSSFSARAEALPQFQACPPTS